MMISKKMMSLSVAVFLLSGCGSSTLGERDTTEGVSGDGTAVSTDNTQVTDETEVTDVVAQNFVISAPQQTLTEKQKNIVTLHNSKRSNEFAGATMGYSLALEAAAQTYANELAASGKFEHDPTNMANGYGENLFAHADQRDLDIDTAMLHWYDIEKPQYDYETGVCNENNVTDSAGNVIVCGHYTQVVWQETREVGCAMANYENNESEYRDGSVYVCKYKKPGNIIGEKPYCLEYNTMDIYSGGVPTVNTDDIVDKALSIELVVEDRVNCTRIDNTNGSIKFAKGFQSAQLIDFDIFNGDSYTVTLDFDTVTIQDNMVMMTGKGLEENQPSIFMNIKFVGETSSFYGVELEWNGYDAAQPQYSRKMKAKLYK